MIKNWRFLLVLVGYTPHAKKETAHHMLMFGCDEVDHAGPGDYWWVARHPSTCYLMHTRVKKHDFWRALVIKLIEILSWKSIKIKYSSGLFASDTEAYVFRSFSTIVSQQNVLYSCVQSKHVSAREAKTQARGLPRWLYPSLFHCFTKLSFTKPS